MLRTPVVGTRPLSRALARKHMPALDGLRAVAVAVVLLYHADLNVPGDLGVTGFFVLSGFLITWLLLREQRRTGTIDVRAFYRRRVLRIFPAYFALVGFSLLVDAMLGDPWTNGRIAAALTYTINYHNAAFGHTGPIAHAWSLAIEEQFYLLWPAVFLLLLARRWLTGGLMWLIAVVALWRSSLWLGGASDAYVYNAFDTRFDSLAIGCLLAVLCTRPAFVAGCERIAAPWAPLVTLAALYVSRTVNPTWHYTLGFTVDSVLIAVLIVQLMQVSRRTTWRWLDARVTVWFGNLSYPLYLWHIWGFDAARNLPLAPAAQTVAGIAISIALAAASYYGIEHHFLRRKQPAPKKAPRLVVRHQPRPSRYHRFLAEI